MYKSIDLFAGIGGIRLGFEQAFKGDIKTVFVSEWDKKAVETYKANYNDGIDVVGDITKVDEKDIPSHDILLAGFPCQAFSLAGQKRGFEDARGTLFFDVARIVKYHKPKVVFCENVKNLVNHDRGRTFDVIKSVLEDLGYKVFYKVLNSKNLGVPQNRERIYIVGFRNDISPEDFMRELSRLQGFPDNFKFVVADTHLYKQFGNSVTVPVIRAIAEKIKEHLEKENIEAGKKE